MHDFGGHPFGFPTNFDLHPDAEIQTQLDIIKRAVERIAELQAMKKAETLPLMPMLPVYKTPQCSVCGMVWTGPMSYTCMNRDCPSGVSCDSTK